MHSGFSAETLCCPARLDYATGLIVEHDRFLLCSDGLYSALGDVQLALHLQRDSPEEASRALVEAACSAGALDNVTAVVVAVGSVTSLVSSTR